jgi:hypothetical protein
MSDEEKNRPEAPESTHSGPPENSEISGEIVVPDKDAPAPPAELPPVSVKPDPEPDAAPGHGHAPAAGEGKHFFDHKKNVDLVLNIFYAGSALLVVIGLMAQFLHWPYHPHSAFADNVEFAAGPTFNNGGFETTIPAFYCFYGFIACTVLVICATQLRKVLMRREDYYDVQ